MGIEMGKEVDRGQGWLAVTSSDTTSVRCSKVEVAEGLTCTLSQCACKAKPEFREKG